MGDNLLSFRQGRVSAVSTLPTGSNLKNLLIAIAAIAGLGGCTTSSKTVVTLDYYQVGGTTLEQIDKEIKDKGPRINGTVHAVAISNIKMIPDVSFIPTANGCAVKRARIKVRANVVLPRWKNRKLADKKLGQTWDNLDRYTRLHEATHVAIADKHARRLEQKLETINIHGSCEAAGKIAKKTINRAMKSHEREQLGFDSSEKKRFARLAKRGKPS